MWQHASLSLQAPFVFQGTSTELFRWAAERGVSVQVVVLERIRDRRDLLFREAAWTQAAIDAQWLVPGVERWGAQSKNMIGGSLAKPISTNAIPDFNAVDLSQLELLSDVVAGVRAQDFTPGFFAPKYATDEIDDSKHLEKHSIQLLVNPANCQPFYVGITRPKDGQIEPGDGDEVSWRAEIFAAVHGAKKFVQVVEVERVGDIARAKTAKLFWIEMLVRSNANLINNELPKCACIAAYRFHTAACGRLVGDDGSSLDSPDNSLPNSIGEVKVFPSLPIRHGKKWSPEETSSVQEMYERGVQIGTIANDRDRKASGILAKLAKLAKSDSRLANRLRSAGLLKSDGRPEFSGLS